MSDQNRSYAANLTKIQRAVEKVKEENKLNNVASQSEAEFEAAVKAKYISFGGKVLEKDEIASVEVKEEDPESGVTRRGRRIKED